MSEPKLRKLFRQTFGKGVFEYYQSLRMQEAARLLKEKHLAVSEIGYQLGFTNLSHFSKVFEAYIGICLSWNNICTTVNGHRTFI